MSKIRKWLKEFFTMLSIPDPNSPEGLRYRAKKLISDGTSFDHPYVSSLIKQALLKEHRENEIPNPDVWDKMTDEAREDWVLSQLKMEAPKQ